MENFIFCAVWDKIGQAYSKQFSKKKIENKKRKRKGKGRTNEKRSRKNTVLVSLTRKKDNLEINETTLIRVLFALQFDQKWVTLQSFRHEFAFLGVYYKNSLNNTEILPRRIKLKIYLKAYFNDDMTPR